MTAANATATHVIERISSSIKSHRDGMQVNLSERQGNRWVVVRRNISMSNALDYGFDCHSQSVRQVFGLEPLEQPSVDCNRYV